MGAKAPADKTPEGIHRCEFCGRSMMSVTSLRAHQHTLHSQAMKERDKRRITRSKASTNVPETLKVGLKAAKVAVTQPKLARKSERTSITKAEITVERTADEDKKVVFKCPCCDKVYPVYFPAMKHIEKVHAKGNAELISLLPVKCQICVHCNQNVKSNESHSCPTIIKRGTEENLISLWCARCEQTFPTAKLFDIHVKTLHGSVDTMFFTDKNDFTSWHSDMEAQTQCNYYIMAQYNDKNIYRCSGHILDTEDPFQVRFCPSMMIYQEFTKGIQLQYFKEHSDHQFSPYVLKPEFASNSLTDLLNQSQNYTEIDQVKSDEGDVYLQFKTLMHGIVCDSAKLKVEKLKLLLSEAFAMTKLLTGFVDDDDCVMKTEDLPQLVVNLTSTTASSRSLPVETKSKFSLSDDKDSTKILKALDNADDKPVTTDKVEHHMSPILLPKKPNTASPSFNDTYKDFIGQATSSNKKGKVTSAPVKTYPGKTSLQDKKDKKIDNSYTRSAVAKTSIDKVEIEIAPAKTRFGKTTVINDTEIAKRMNTPVKTKIGQFKPSMLRKTPNKIVKNRRSSAGKVKEINYEVKEQENDCNILILKI